MGVKMKPSATGKANGEPTGLDDAAARRLAGKEAVPLSVLVSDLSKDLGYSTDRVTEGVMGLQSRKSITISEKSPYVSFSSYAASPKSLWFWAALAATLLSVAFVFATSGFALYLRYAFGGLLILFLPGYSLIETVYSKRELDELSRFALSIGLSLALVPLVGLALNYTPFGIRLLPITLSLAGLTVLLLVLAVRRKHASYMTTRGVASG